jgi:tellurite resistance protein TehA-like permease
MVMATGIVSVGLGLAGSPDLSAGLLWVAVVAFAVLVAASACRVVAFGRDVRAELRRSDRVFSYFALPGRGQRARSQADRERPGRAWWRP